MEFLIGLIVIAILFLPSIIAALLTLFFGRSKRSKNIIIICNTLFFTYILRNISIVPGVEWLQGNGETIIVYVFIIGTIFSILISLLLSIIGVSIGNLLMRGYKKAIALVCSKNKTQELAES